MPRKNQTSVTLNVTEITALLDTLVGAFPENYSDEENETIDRLIRKMERALDRAEG